MGTKATQASGQRPNRGCAAVSAVALSPARMHPRAIRGQGPSDLDLRLGNSAVVIARPLSRKTAGAHVDMRDRCFPPKPLITAAGEATQDCPVGVLSCSRLVRMSTGLVVSATKKRQNESELNLTNSRKRCIVWPRAVSLALSPPPWRMIEGSCMQCRYHECLKR